MELKYCKLTPISPLHLGEREFWREGSSVFIHSDTLFSGVCHCYSLLYGQHDLERFIKDVREKQLLRISSAFPFWGDRFYWPVPKNQIPEEKEAYKVQFIEKRGFEQLLEGKRLETLIKEKAAIIPAKDEPHTPWQLTNVPRISLSRFNNHPLEEGGYFHSGRMTYRESAGLFFLYQTDASETETRFKASLRMLADEGIGGDRSSGNGLMKTPEFETMKLDIPSEADAEITLSLYYPAEKEIHALQQGYYELLERKGYIYSPHGQSLRRCSIRMFTEGSVFPKMHDRTGSTEDVTPKIFTHHPVYRYGLFFGLPCKNEVSPA